MVSETDEVSLCLLRDFDSVNDAVQSLLNVSKSRIKKFNLSKKFLNKKVSYQDEIALPLDLVNSQMINPNYQGPDVKILFEDERIMVMDKPFNIHCHPLAYTQENNCLSFLRSNNEITNFLNVNNNSYDRGLLYRLDYGTSGVLFYIKDQSLFELMRLKFNLLTKEKLYYSIVDGNFNKDGESIQYLHASGVQGSKMKVFDKKDVKKDCLEGVLQIEKIQYNRDHNVSLVKVRLKTGIRHQIRAQLSFLGHPIIGDELYGGRKEKRIFLHAYKYQFNVNNEIFEGVSNNLILFDKFFGLDCCF